MTIDIEKTEELSTYLEKYQNLASEDLKNIRPLSGGVSNRTMMVEHRDGRSWVIKQALEKLRVQVDWFCDPIRIRRESEAIRFLNAHVPQARVPKFWFEDQEQNILGMESVPKPHQVWKLMLFQEDVNSSCVVQFAEMLAGIHVCGPETFGMPSSFEDITFFEALRLEPYYGYAASKLPKAEKFLKDLMESTRLEKRFLVHGDFSPKNVLVHQDMLFLIDHEVIHLGDAAFDLGFALTHLLAKSIHLPKSQTLFQQACHEFASVYLQVMSRHAKSSGLESRWVRHTLGCLLARVHGRSPLEYLLDSEKETLTTRVLQNVAKPPENIHTLIDCISC